MGLLRRVAAELGRAVRETSTAVDRVGLRALEKPLFREPFARHRPVMNLFDKHPAVSPDAFVAPNAAVIGAVTLGTRASVMYGAVLRGDLNDVSVGAFSSIGERATVHTSKSVEGHVAAGVSIGAHVVVGPGAMLQSCTIEDGASVGANAVVMEGALVEAAAQLAPGAVVHPGRRIPAGQLWAGNPAAYVRDLSKAELAEAEGHAEEAADVAAEHAHEFLPQSAVYLHAEALGVEDKVRRAARRASAAAAAHVSPEHQPSFHPRAPRSPPPPLRVPRPRSALRRSTTRRRHMRPPCPSSAPAACPPAGERAARRRGRPPR